MKNALNNQVGMLGDMFLWLVANLKQGVIYFIKQGGGNHKIAWVYVLIWKSLVIFLLLYWNSTVEYTLDGNKQFMSELWYVA